MILFKIAFRNLREHKSKTLIIGTLVALGIAFLVIGNSVMESITEGMEASYVENFTGDLIIRSASEEEVSFLGGFGSAPPEVLADYTDITTFLDQSEDIEAYTPLLTGAATINQQDQTLSFALLWGIEPSSYYEMFPDSFILNEGERLKDGEEGILLSQTVVDTVLEEHGVTLTVGDAVLLSGQNDVTGNKIREVTVRGIGTFENSAGILDTISFVDVNTLRTLTGLTAVSPYTSSEQAETPVEVDEEGLFAGVDALFSDSVVSDAATTSRDTAIDFENLLGDTSVRDQYLALDNNAWYFLLLDVADGASLADVGRNAGAAGNDLVIETWRWGAGFIAELAYGIRNILNVIILVVSIVAIIIIMNTLVISVTERMAEIGTVRAIGGQRNFVRSMITVEVLMITLIFGLIGMAIGSAVIGLLSLAGLSASNLFLQVLFGGSVLKPALSVGSLFTSTAVVAIIGVVASLYPVSVALGIAPVQAMQKR